MQTLEQIHQQIARLPRPYIFWTQKEIRYLPQILMPDERILAITSGFMRNTTWLCVCTDRRVIFLDRGMIFGLKQIQMSHDRIQSIDSSYGLIFGSIRVWDGASSMVVTLIWKSSIDVFVRATRDAIDTFRRQMHAEMAGAGRGAASVDVAPQIERLAKLKEAGHLTEEEFQQQKQKLLSA